MTQETLKLCAVEGCSRPAEQRGWCGMHYLRWRRHGDPTVRLRNAPGEGGACEHEGYIIEYSARVRWCQHRRIAQEVLGRELLPGEVVHHKNEDRSDNRPENLEVMTRKEHSRLHHPKGKVKDSRNTETQKYCPECDTVKLRATDFYKNRSTGDGLDTKCRECSKRRAAVHNARPEVREYNIARCRAKNAKYRAMPGARERNRERCRARYWRLKAEQEARG